jgi:hypothetical protein
MAGVFYRAGHDPLLNPKLAVMGGFFGIFNSASQESRLGQS